MRYPVDTHTDWTCAAPASLMVEAWWRGRQPHTLHGQIYTCPAHQGAAEEWVTAAEAPYAELVPTVVAHPWDPWPCGHLTIFDTVGEALRPGPTTTS